MEHLMNSDGLKHYERQAKYFLMQKETRLWVLLARMQMLNRLLHSEIYFIDLAQKESIILKLQVKLVLISDLNTYGTLKFQHLITQITFLSLVQT